MVELADALASGASDRKIVRVQVPPSAPKHMYLPLASVLRALLVRKSARGIFINRHNRPLRKDSKEALFVSRACAEVRKGYADHRANQLYSHTINNLIKTQISLRVIIKCGFL